MADFPRWRVHQRAWVRTNNTLTNFWWVPIVTAVLASLVATWTAASSTVHWRVFVHPLRHGVQVYDLVAHQSWTSILINSLLAGVGTFVLLGLLIYLRNRWSYRRAGFRDDVWEAEDPSYANNLVVFRLVRRPDTAPLTGSVFGIMQVVLRTPRGMVHIEDDEIQNQGSSLSSAMYVSPPPEGEYEVRWYGSRPTTNRGRRHPYYEIARHTHHHKA